MLPQTLRQAVSGEAAEPAAILDFLLKLITTARFVVFAAAIRFRLFGGGFGGSGLRLRRLRLASFPPRSGQGRTRVQVAA